MAKKKTSKTPISPAVDRAAPCSAFVIFAESLRKMAGFYTEHPSTGHIRPVDAIQMALCDAAGAAEYAAQGKRWVKPGVWETPNVRPLATAHGSANTPLRAFVSDKILTVQIGVEVLEWASRPENGGTLERCKVDRRRCIEWAKDVINEMTREDEVGNSPLAQFLDDMMDKAADSGSAALCWPNAKLSHEEAGKEQR